MTGGVDQSHADAFGLLERRGSSGQSMLSRRRLARGYWVTNPGVPGFPTVGLLPLALTWTICSRAACVVWSQTNARTWMLDCPPNEQVY